MKTLEDKINELSPDRRAGVEARAQQLRRELATLDELRRIYAGIRGDAAKSLKLPPAKFAKLERDSDQLLSSLRDAVEALGGTLSLSVELPGHAPAEFTSLMDLVDANGKG